MREELKNTLAAALERRRVAEEAAKTATQAATEKATQTVEGEPTVQQGGQS